MWQPFLQYFTARSSFRTSGRKVSPAARIFIRKNRAVIFGQPYFFVMGMGYLKNRGTQFLTFHFVYVILSSNCAFGLGLCAQRQELRNKDWRDCHTLGHIDINFNTLERGCFVARCNPSLFCDLGNIFRLDILARKLDNH